MLLEACRVEDPDEAEKAVLEGCGISSVISEDLSFFRKLTHLDLGDNRVQFAALAYLPALIELHLDCNGLREITCPAGGFPTLEVLNLSYNGLSTAAISALADVPRLRQLDISMNELTGLPADMSEFGALQSLNCEHNALGSEASFLALGSIPALRSLSLAHNRVDSLPSSSAEGSFSMLSTLDLAHNIITNEEALLPILQMATLRTLLLYGNPFLRHGSASDDFHEVLAGQRGVELITLPPPPPQPPAKIDLSGMTTVSEPPSRRYPPRAAKAAAAKAPEGAGARKEEEEGGSFFLTEGGCTSSEADGAPTADPAFEAAQAAALDTDFWTEEDALFAQNVDMRTAVTALKAAIERPPVRPTNASAHHLKSTASIAGRRRNKVESGPSHRTLFGATHGKKLANGMMPPHRAGGAADDMAAGLAELQHRMGGHAAARGGVMPAHGSPDPAGDAGVASFAALLGGMGEMQVGAKSGALPTQPFAA